MIVLHRAATHQTNIVQAQIFSPIAKIRVKFHGMLNIKNISSEDLSISLRVR